MGDGFLPWLDEEDLLPGEHFELSIANAVRQADFVVVCLSAASTTRTGYVHKEITRALDVAGCQPDGTIFVIPARLEMCNVPARLQHLHWVDLFAPGGYLKLTRALNGGRGYQVGLPSDSISTLAEAGPGAAPSGTALRHAVDAAGAIGRADPCWCGSGKKFLRCHGA